MSSKETGLRSLAQRMESKGRHGDSILVHMNPKELEFLTKLSGVQPTINPETGLPEAFSLWKTLLGVGLGAAALFTGGASLGLSGPLVAALHMGAAAVPGLTGGLAAAAASSVAGGLTPGQKSGSGTPTSAAETAAFIRQRDQATADKYIKSPLLNKGNELVGFSSPKGGFTPLSQLQAPPPPPDPQQQAPGYAQGGGISGEEQQAAKIVAAAMAAMRGEHPRPKKALNDFVSYYGPDALAELKAKAGVQDAAPQQQDTGLLKGPGAGMDDMISASVGGKKDVLLSDGEFVVPADVVSNLGDGSTDAGAKRLHAMMDRVRHSRNGTTRQPGKINPNKVMPA